jgi:hypothetical protein
MKLSDNCQPASDNCLLHLSRTLYKSGLFMQNKPNLPDAQMNVSSVKTTNYDQITMNNANKNKPNQTQFHPHRLYTCYNFLLRDVARRKLCSKEQSV